MKTTAKLKKFGLTVLLALVGIALVFSCFSFRMPALTAFAEEEEKNPDPVIADIFENITVPKECDYGDSFTVKASASASVTVTAPNGKDVDLGTAASNGYTVKADQVGNYKVTYTANDKGDFATGAQKSFYVKVTLDKEYFLKVDFDGAAIPTYIKKGDKFTLPGANVVYYDEDNILQKYEPATDVVVDVYDSDGNSYKPGAEFTASKNGKIYLTYSAKVGGTSGLKYYNKVFTVNCQSTLTESNSAPTLSVSGVTSDISINRPVTLPVATATDSYDDNVQIEVSVKDPNGENVKNVKIDRNGYAYELKDTEVEFDNNKSMTFYPVMTGDYTVTYIATNDAGKTSSPRVYHMTCKDLVAPVFKETYDYNIPETWGLTVKKLNSENEEVVDEDLGGKITFKIPEVVDNKDHAYAKDEDDTDLISLYFRITDADNSRTIISFDNILLEGDTSKFKGNTTYGEKDGDTYLEEVFDKEKGFTFDFNKYHKTDANGEVVDLPGTYTVYFRARDKAQNTSSKTYTIKLEEEFVDTAAPSAAEVTVPSHISTTDKTLTIPSPVVADAKDSRPEVTYRLYSDNTKPLEEGGRYITVNGGEVADIVNDGTKLSLVINKGKSDAQGSFEKVLELGNTIYFYVEVKDKVGNIKVNTESGEYDPENENLYEDVESKIFILSPTNEHGFTLNEELDFGSDEIKAGESINVGGFNIAIDSSEDDLRPYIGFEIAVLDPNGNALNVTLETFATRLDQDSTVYVKNITFKPSVAGEHSLIVTAFDVNGKTTSVGGKFNVVKSATGGATTSAAVIGSSGNVNVTYNLHNEKMTGIGDAGKTYFVIRRISGGSFALMGSEFTAKTQGSYSVRDGYIEYKDTYSGDEQDFADYDYDEDFKAYGGNDGRYSFSVTDTSSPVIEVQGHMPTYSEISTKDKKVEVKLPAVIAYTENGMAEVKVDITDPNGSTVKPTELDEDGYAYSFESKINGAYTVTYTATYMKASPVTATYTINVGDVEGPEFTVSGGSSGRYVVGDTFTFGTMTIEDTTEKGLTITKKIIDPSSSEVSAATVSGSYNTYRESANNGTEITFSQAGKYEVVYTATDAYGNETTQRYTITVVSSGSGTPTTITTLSTVLIIVAVVLLAGVIIYVVRFRKVKEKK